MHFYLLTEGHVPSPAGFRTTSSPCIQEGQGLGPFQDSSGSWLGGVQGAHPQDIAITASRQGHLGPLPEAAVLAVEAIRGPGEADADGRPRDAAWDGQVVVMATGEAVDEDTIDVGGGKGRGEDAEPCGGAVPAGEAAILGGEGTERRDGAGEAGIQASVHVTGKGVAGTLLAQDGRRRRQREAGALHGWPLLTQGPQGSLGDAEQGQDGGDTQGDRGEDVNDPQLPAQGSAEAGSVPVDAPNHIAKATSKTWGEKQGLEGGAEGRWFQFSPKVLSSRQGPGSIICPSDGENGISRDPAGTPSPVLEGCLPAQV